MKNTHTPGDSPSPDDSPLEAARLLGQAMLYASEMLPEKQYARLQETALDHIGRPDSLTADHMRALTQYLNGALDFYLGRDS